MRDAFYSSPQLPSLFNGDTVKRTICDGVTQDTLGYASKDAGGRLKLEKLKQNLIDADVEISDDMFIIKAEDARQLLEPPRPAKLIVRPEQVVLKTGEQASFSCAAADQYGEPFTAPGVTWSATGGTVTATGPLTAGQTGGLHTLRAEAAGHEALARISHQIVALARASCPCSRLRHGQDAHATIATLCRRLSPCGEKCGLAEVRITTKDEPPPLRHRLANRLSAGAARCPRRNG